MLPQVCLESAGHGIEAVFARALPAATSYDLAFPVESLQKCMRYVDVAFLLDVSGFNPLGWSFRAEAGLKCLKGAAAEPASCLADKRDKQFTRRVLIPSYREAITADQPVVHRVAGVANDTFIAYRKMTIPLRRAGATKVSHILTMTLVDLAIDGIDSRGKGALLLTFRERQCLSAAAGGLMGKQIAAEIGLSEKTVELHLSHARRKLGARTTAQAVAISLTMASHGIHKPAVSTQ